MREDSTYSYNNSTGSFQLECCDWRAVIEIKTEPLVVIVNHNTYKLAAKEMTFEEFRHYTNIHKYKSVLIAAEFIGVSLPCARCGGDGKSDWVLKVMKKKKTALPPPYHRDPYGPIRKFRIPLSKNPHIPQENQKPHPFFCFPFLITYLEKDITFQHVYTSIPHLTNEEELCPGCYGSGLRMIADGQTELVTQE